jgi:hypothetical protein
MTQVDKFPMKRRDFVRVSAAAGVAALAASKATPASAAGSAAAEGSANSTSALLPPPYVGAGSNAPVRPFLLSDVSLGAGLLQEKRDRMKNFLRQYDERRFLVLFDPAALDGFRLHHGALPLLVGSS